jgi:Cdc6-like AAA superfamily ATPase
MAGKRDDEDGRGADNDQPLLKDDELLTTAKEQLATKELEHYRPFSGELLVALPEEWPTVREDVRAQTKELAAARMSLTLQQRAADRAGRWVWTLAAACCGLLTLLAALLAAEAFSDERLLLAIPGVSSWSRTSREVIFALLAAGAAAAAVGIARILSVSLPSVRAAAAARRAEYSVESKFLDARRVAVTQAVRRIINQVLGPIDQLIFPTDAPALVELDSARIIASDTIDDLLRFIHQHSASTIGVAGPRGVGKTTILRRVAQAEDPDDLGVVVPTPVRYEQADFTRRLFSEVIKAAQTRSMLAGPTPYLRRMDRFRKPLIRLVSAAVLLVFGAGALFLGAQDPPLRPNGLQILGGMCIFFSLVLTMVAYATALMPRSWRIRSRRSTRDEQKAIDKALVVLRWREEVTSTSKTTIKPLAGLLEASEDDTRKDTAVEITHAEMVAELRDFLRDYVRAAQLRRIVIAIDELDKLAEADSLVAAINGLKDLFHIEGTHFVVSVSTDALDNFALRGVPARDAFDSSFDTIVSVRRLQATQSIALVDARSTGFPAPLVLFCHAWSGGLPRDLLRAARACIETYANRESTTQDALVRNLVREAVAGALASYARSRGLEVGAALRSAVRLVRNGAILEAASAVKALEEAVEQPQEIQIIRHYMEVAQEVVDEYAIPTPLNTWSAMGSDPHALARADELAIRMAAVGDGEIELLSGVTWAS